MLTNILPLILGLTYIVGVIASQENTETANQTKQQKSVSPIFYASGKLEKQEEPQLSQQQHIPPQFFQRQQLVPNLLGNPYLEQQFQFPDGFSRVPLQIVLYGGQGQPILINPGSPPGNFLVPQAPGPNVILRDTPQRPVFVAGYPKPAHVPPIEKDAEEIPTNPEKIPPFQDAHSANKPEKLETFNEGENQIPTHSAEEPAASVPVAKNPKFATLRPGQRFFILNGEPLFSNYPLGGDFPQNVNLKYAQPLPFYPPNPLFPQQENPDGIPVQNNSPQSQIPNVAFNSPFNLLSNLVPVPQNGQEGFFRNAVQPFALENDEEVGQFRYTPDISENPFKFQDDLENESVIVDAELEDFRRGNGATSENAGAPVVANEKLPEQSMAQAAPGAVAIAGPGGAAESAPRGNAIVGKGGLAVSSPHATAVAGQRDTDKKKKPNKKN